MNLKNFKAQEDGENFHVMHPNGSKFTMKKSELSKEAHAMIKKMCSGGMMAKGGKVQKLAGDPDDDSASEVQDAPININITPDRSPASIAPASPYAISGDDAAKLTKYVEPAPLPANDPTRMAQEQKAQQQQALMAALPQSAPAPSVAPTAPMANAPAAPGAPDPMMVNGKSMEKAYRTEQQANLDYANAVGGEGAAEQKAIADMQEKMQQLPTQQKIINDDKQNSERLFNEYASKRIEPNQFWHNALTGSKIAAGIGLFLGGMSTPFTHQANPAIGIMQSAIDRDIDAQKNEQGKAHNLWSMNREALGTDLAANLATQNQMYTGLKYQLMSAASQFKGPMAAANAKNLNAQIDQKIAQNSMMLSLMQGPTQEAQDPATHVGMLQRFGLATKEQAEGSLKEIKDRENITANEPKIFSAFDEATKQHLTDYIPGTENQGQMALKQLLLPHFKNIDGTVRQAAMDETFNNVVPRFGDSSAKVAAKRQSLADWITSEKAAPVSKSIGLDLDRYQSTKEPAPAPRMGNTAQKKVQIFMQQNPSIKDPNQAMQILKKAGRL